MSGRSVTPSWLNPATGAVEAVPRHTEIANVLANKMLVMVDGRAVSGCLHLAVFIEGARVATGEASANCSCATGYEHILVGHTSINVTLNTYGHLFPDAFADVGEALDRLVRAAAARAS